MLYSSEQISAKLKHFVLFWKPSPMSAMTHTMAKEAQASEKRLPFCWFISSQLAQLFWCFVKRMSNDILMIRLNILIFIEDIFWKYIDDKIEHFDQTSVTSGPDYGCACLIDLSELYLNSKKSFGVTRKTFSWQNQINQHHKYDWIEKVWAKITLSSKWKENKTNSTLLIVIMLTISS